MCDLQGFVTLVILNSGFAQTVEKNLRETLFVWGHDKGQQRCIYPDLAGPLTAVATKEQGGRCGKMCYL